MCVDIWETGGKQKGSESLVLTLSLQLASSVIDQVLCYRLYVHQGLVLSWGDSSVFLKYFKKGQRDWDIAFPSWGDVLDVHVSYPISLASAQYAVLFIHHYSYVPCEKGVQLKVNRGSHRHSSSCEPSLSSQPSSTPPATREIVDLWVNTSSPVQPTSSAFVAAYREMAELRIVAIARPATRAAHTYMCKLRGTYRTAKAQQANRLHPGQLFFHGKKSCPKLDSNLQSRSIRQWHHYCTDR